MNPPGAFVVSLDFELYWGMRDKVPLARYRDRLLGVREAIPAMLERFERHGIHATWAAVGMLLFDDRATLLAALPDPAERPAYRRPGLSAYAGLDALGTNEASDPFHFGLSLARRIAATPGQEIATHTFSHYYCLEPGQTEAQFRADLAAARRAAARVGLPSPVSLVFPRNQCQPAYLAACRDAGIRAWRGNEDAWMYDARAGDEVSRVMRAARLMDSHVNISGHHCSARPVPGSAMPVDIPASRFLRPTRGGQGARALSRLRVERIRSSMTAAARAGRVFHLWWHPHNLGIDLGANLAQLDAVLGHFARLRARHGFESVSMGELAGA